MRRAIEAIQRTRNLESFSIATNAILFANANRGKDTSAYENLAPFLPHPRAWSKQNRQRKIHVSRAAAIEFLNSYKRFGSDVAVTFEDWLEDLTAIARGE